MTTYSISEAYISRCYLDSRLRIMFESNIMKRRLESIGKDFLENARPREQEKLPSSYTEISMHNAKNIFLYFFSANCLFLLYFILNRLVYTVYNCCKYKE